MSKAADAAQHGWFRVQQGSAQLGPNGLYACTFEAYVGRPGDETIVGSTRSPHVFADDLDAYAKGNRALDFFEEVGRLPDLSSTWWLRCNSG